MSKAQLNACKALVAAFEDELDAYSTPTDGGTWDASQAVARALSHDAEAARCAAYHARKLAARRP